MAYPKVPSRFSKTKIKVNKDQILRKINVCVNEKRKNDTPALLMVGGNANFHGEKITKNIIIVHPMVERLNSKSE